MGGALKNVLAIACGISDGLGFGNNARAALITRGLVEITRLAVASGAHPMTMGGLAGMGDLVLTCTGTLVHYFHTIYIAADECVMTVLSYCIHMHAVMSGELESASIVVRDRLSLLQHRNNRSTVCMV